METRKVGEIKVGQRHRKDMGDIESLASSIGDVGLLHPIVVLPDNTLVVGERRLCAVKKLGWDAIEVSVAASLADARSFIRAESDENTCRKSFTPGEAVEIGLRVEEAYQPVAEEAQKQSPGRPKKGGATCPMISDRDESARTTAVAASAVGMSRRSYEKAKAVVESGDAEAIAEMEKTGKVDKAHRKLEQKARVETEHAAAQAALDAGLLPWVVTADTGVVPCQALVTDPPYGILDEEWEPKDLETFTVDWASRWSVCDADLLAIFWSQRYLWDGRAWFDHALAGYTFQQLLVWHYANNKSPQSRQGFKQTWEPIFLYRRDGATREIRVDGTQWGDGINDFDCHVAAVPQSNFNGADAKQHPAQKPVAVMRWLVAALTSPGGLVADPFCGSGTTGIAAVQLGRRFHGIEIDPAFREMASGRIAAYGRV
jgi:hypothetical protein